MAGSPRYLTLLAQIADHAEMLVPEYAGDLARAWADYDEAWKEVELRQNPVTLATFSTMSMIVLHLISGEAIERLAQQGMDLHIRKNAGYAGATNPDVWANFRMATAFGVSALRGALVRLSDKYIRTVNLRADPNNDQVGEAITDTLRDAVAYPLISICLMEEEDAA